MRLKEWLKEIDNWRRRGPARNEFEKLKTEDEAALIADIKRGKRLTGTTQLYPVHEPIPEEDVK
jgi:hypothetical protein